MILSVVLNLRVKELKVAVIDLVNDSGITGMRLASGGDERHEFWRMDLKNLGLSRAGVRKRGYMLLINCWKFTGELLEKEGIMPALALAAPGSWDLTLAYLSPLGGRIKGI